MGYIAHLSNNNKIEFMESYTKYMDYVLEQILY